MAQKKKISHFWANYSTIKSYFRSIFRPGTRVNFRVPCVALYNILLISLMLQHKVNRKLFICHAVVFPHIEHAINYKRAGLFLHDPEVLCDASVFS